MFQAQNRETINSTWKVAVSFKIIMTTSVTRSCFTTHHQTYKTETKTKTTTCKIKTKTDFWSQTSLVLWSTVSGPHHRLKRITKGVTEVTARRWRGLVSRPQHLQSQDLENRDEHRPMLRSWRESVYLLKCDDTCLLGSVVT